MKNPQKGFVIPIIIAIVALLAIGGGIYIYTNNKVEAPVSISDKANNVSTTTPGDIVGGDKDAYGCIGSAGYTWCAVKNKCLRVWEEECERTPINSGPGDKDGLVACTMDAKQCPDGTYVGRTGPNCEFVCPINNEDSEIENFKKQPGQILSIKKIGENKWELGVDLLTYNSNWSPANLGVPVYLNQNIKVRSLILDKNTIINSCEDSNGNIVTGERMDLQKLVERITNTLNRKGDLASDYIQIMSIISSQITATYEQCAN